MAENPNLLAMANAAADSAGVPRQLLWGLVKRESDWNPFAVSAAGALGLTQVMPVWANNPSYANSIGLPGLTVERLMDPQTNLTAGARILAAELARFGSWELALMAYNAGSPAVMRAVAAAKSDEPKAVSDQLPAAETRSYWQAVMNFAAMYAHKMGEAEAALENATVDVVENVKESGAVAPLMLVGLAILGIWWAVTR